MVATMAKKHFVIMHHSRTSEQKKIHQKIERDGLCPFCWENFLKYHPKPIIQKGKNWLVTHNAWPYKGTKIHLLLISKRHREHINALTKKEWGELHTLIKKYSPTDGGSLFFRFGDANKTGASVTHLHCHIITGGKRKTKKTRRLEVQLGYQ